MKLCKIQHLLHNSRFVPLFNPALNIYELLRFAPSRVSHLSLASAQSFSNILRPTAFWATSDKSVRLNRLSTHTLLGCCLQQSSTDIRNVAQQFLTLHAP